MLEEKISYQVEITEGDHVQVRKRTTILKDGVPIASNLHRHVVSPGEDFASEPKKVRRACEAAHTPVAVNRHQAREAHQNALLKLEDEDNPSNRAAEQAAKKALKDAEKLYDDDQEQP